MRSANESCRPIGTEGQVGDLSRAVTSNAVAGKSLNFKIQHFRDHRHAEVDADAATDAGVVERTHRAGSCRAIHRALDLLQGGRNARRSRVALVSSGHAAWEYAVAERTYHSVNLVVSPAWIDRKFDDSVGGFVDRVSAGVNKVQQ